MRVGDAGLQCSGAAAGKLGEVELKGESVCVTGKERLSEEKDDNPSATNSTTTFPLLYSTVGMEGGRDCIAAIFNC